MYKNRLSWMVNHVAMALKVRMDIFYIFHNETSLYSNWETSWKYAPSILIP